MAFGIFIDVPLLLIPFILFIKFRKQIANLIKKIRLPTFILFLISSVPFIIFEENINCGAFDCQYTFLPFTLYFLLGFLLILGLIVKFTHTQKFFLTILIFSILGTIFEIFLGSSRVEFQALPPLSFVLISIWVMISYAFISVVPLTILLEDKGAGVEKKR